MPSLPRASTQPSSTVFTRSPALHPATDLTDWRPEDSEFWAREGEAVARRNLIISIAALLAAFAVWTFWSVVAVQMLSLGFPFTSEDLFNLQAIAGLTGATLRIPSSFLIRIAGGRNTIFLSTFLMLIPTVGTGFALQNPETPLWIFQLLALMSGIGGGNFASSMSNISFFYPKRKQGTALGLNGGLGNAGVTTLQILVPLVMTVPLFGGSAMKLKTPSGTLLGKIPAGTETWIHNSGVVWALILLPIVVLSWFKMNNINTADVTPDCPRPSTAFGRILSLLGIGMLASAVGAFLVLPKPTGAGLPDWSKWLVLPGVIFLTVNLLKAIPGKVRTILSRQYQIFSNSHTWIKSTIYTMTFGSFIGYSAAFPLSIKLMFGFQHIADSAGNFTHTTVNPAGPPALMYAWIGPFIGAFARPVGGWLADRFGGARITQIMTGVMIASALGVAHTLNIAYHSATPEVHFPAFLSLFLVLFAASGIGNGSVFRSIAMIFTKEQAGPVLGWASAIAAYGAFVIPKVFGEQLQAGTPEYALYGFAGFYLICLALNWWCYLGPRAQFKNP